MSEKIEFICIECGGALDSNQCQFKTCKSYQKKNYLRDQEGNIVNEPHRPENIEQDKFSNTKREAGLFYEQKLLNGTLEVVYDTIKPEYFKCNNLSSDKVIIRFFPKVNCDGLIEPKMSQMAEKNDYKLNLFAQAHIENNALFIEVNLENISQQDIMLPNSIRKRHLKISVLDETNLVEMDYKQVRKIKQSDDPFYYTFKLKTGAIKKYLLLIHKPLISNNKISQEIQYDFEFGNNYKIEVQFQCSALNSKPIISNEYIFQYKHQMYEECFKNSSMSE